MNLYSLSFLYLFLPASVLVYYTAPARARNAVLVFISLAFYALAEPRYLPLLVGSVLFDYACCHTMGHVSAPVRKGLMAIVLIKNALLVMFLSRFSASRELWRPLGVMVYALTSLGYVADVYTRRVECERNLTRFALFCVLFVKLPAGPLLRWEQMDAQLRKRKPSLAQIGEGVILYLQGLAKKILLGNQITAVYDQLAAFSVSEQSVVSTWMMTAALAFAVYFNLSALCDMARGLGKIFSFDLPRNFYYPYQSRNVTEFISRFNITVSDFFTEYLPRRLQEKTGTSMVLGIAFVTLFWSLWFGFKVNFIIWGLYFVFFQLMEKLWLGTLLDKLPVFFTRIYTFAVVLLSFVVFAGNSVDDSIGYIMAMLGLGGQAFSTDSAMYLVSSSYVLLLFAFVLCTSLADSCLKTLRRHTPAFATLLGLTLNAALLVLSTAFLLI